MKNKRPDHEFRNDRPKSEKYLHTVEDGNTLKDEKNTSLPVYFRPDLLKKKKNNFLVPIIVTVISAVVIGTVFGIFLLQLFVGVENEEAEDSPALQSPQAKPQTTVILEDEPTRLSAHVVQAGVFVERQNVEDWQEHYESFGESTFVWERDGQFYLFIGIFATGEEAKEKVEEMQNEDFDVFAKPWVTELENMDSIESEDWMNDFQQAWHESLVQRDAAPLQKLAETGSAADEFQRILENPENENIELELLLLELMYTFDQLND